MQTMRVLNMWFTCLQMHAAAHYTYYGSHYYKAVNPYQSIIGPFAMAASTLTATAHWWESKGAIYRL